MSISTTPPPRSSTPGTQTAQLAAPNGVGPSDGYGGLKGGGNATTAQGARPGGTSGPEGRQGLAPPRGAQFENSDGYGGLSGQRSNGMQDRRGAPGGPPGLTPP